MFTNDFIYLASCHHKNIKGLNMRNTKGRINSIYQNTQTTCIDSFNTS